MKPAAPQPGPVPVKPAIPQPQIVAARSAAPQPVRPAANVETFAVPLNALAESWPEALRQELARLKLEGKNVQLPCDLIENALKGGRAVFPWKSIRSWIQPPPGDSPHDAAELELPLKVVTPLFFARKNRATKHHQKVAIDESIPNLFFGFPGAETAPPPVGPATKSSAATAGPIAKPVDTNYYIWDDSSDSVVSDETEFRQKTLGGTDFVARYATPNEIASRAAALDGVAGALIALPDGLMVASRIPAELNGDTLAAFLPQIFAKVNQCTRELRMGELNNLNFTVGNIPWKIFRINAIFFAAFGRAGEPLPTADLTALAAELDRKQR
jgi:predicted regulator of Ras-like GTPase activity (Roadblock/LC7/MglB family)